MTLWKPMLAMVVWSGLIVALGLTACGGDDEDEVDCARALAQVQDADCKNAATAAIGGFRACMASCPQEDSACEKACEDDFDDATHACEPAAGILVDECGCEVCGNNLEACIAGQDPAAVCVDNILDCLSGCVS